MLDANADVDGELVTFDAEGMGRSFPAGFGLLAPLPQGAQIRQITTNSSPASGPESLLCQPRSQAVSHQHQQHVGQ